MMSTETVAAEATVGLAASPESTHPTVASPQQSAQGRIAPVIAEVENVSKLFKRNPLFPWETNIWALTNVSLRIQSGEVFGLLGPNRAGKTTLLKVLLSLCHPTSGRVYRFGLTSRCQATLRRIGYVHEDQSFPQYHTASGLLDYYGTLTGLPKSTLRERIPELLGQVGLADRRRERIGKFSKGMLRRLALAQALINDPELLVLDEPSEGLDPEGRTLFHNVVQRQRQRGKTVLLVSHILADVERLCDRVGVLRDGQLVALSAVAALTIDPVTGADRRLETALAEFYGDAPS